MRESTRTRLGLALPSLNTATETEEGRKAMSDSKDQAIKLFGRTIPLPLTCDEAAAGFLGEGGGEENKELPSEETSPGCKDKDKESSNSEEKGEPPASATMCDSQKSLSADQEKTHSKDSKAEAQQQSDKQPPKKPNKILPCPRCNSLDTKFCYYNNYNVNQPRHLCKNCQRYWTAGGTMRNVPVGAGRRKNKSSTSQYHHLTISDATLQSLQSKVPDSIHHSLSNPNGTVLSFSSDTPSYESMTNVLSLAEKSINNCHRTGFHQAEQKKIAPFSCRVEGNGDEHFTASSAMAPKHTKPQDGAAYLEGQGFVPQMLCVDGSTWPYPWSPGPAFCASSCAIPIFPATAYWGCAVPSTWSIPWLSPPAPSPNGSSSCSLPNSPSLGKHSREGDILKNGSQGEEGASKQSSQERCIWIPKTLRIDDPEEGARCSIWATMGTKNDKADAMNGGGLFKPFHKKQQLKNNTPEASQALHANPAALSRSINFQESS